MLNTPFGSFRTEKDLEKHLKDNNIPVISAPIKIDHSMPKETKVTKVVEDLDSIPVVKNEPVIPTSFNPTPKEIIMDKPTPAYEPVKLQYKYFGQCPKCKTHVVTVMLDIKKTTYAVALCPKCNESVEEKKVQPL